jgi:hypothetical protein
LDACATKRALSNRNCPKSANPIRHPDFSHLTGAAGQERLSAYRRTVRHRVST